MKINDKLQSRMLIRNTVLMILSALLINLNVAYGKTFEECFPSKNNFVCEDPYLFLLERGVDVEQQNMIEASVLQLIQAKPKGGCAGGIYRDQKGQVYYLKRSNPLPELLGSKLMNLFVGTQRTPTVKLVKGQYNFTASSALQGFKTKKAFEKKWKFIQKEVELIIAMDLIGLVDRHSGNVGGIVRKNKKPLAARVDFDTSFLFTIYPTANVPYRPNYNHLDLRHLLLTAKTYPRKEVIKALKKFTAIPDEKIIMAIFEGWVTLNRAGYPVEQSTCFDIAQKIIERKNAFRDILRKRVSTSNPSLQKQQQEILFHLHFLGKLKK